MIKKMPGRPKVYPDEKPLPPEDIGDCIERIKKYQDYFQVLSFNSAELQKYQVEKFSRVAYSAEFIVDYLIDYAERVARGEITNGVSMLKRDLIEVVAESVGVSAGVANTYIRLIASNSQVSFLGPSYRRNNCDNYRKNGNRQKKGVSKVSSRYTSAYDSTMIDVSNGRHVRSYAPRS